MLTKNTCVAKLVLFSVLSSRIAPAWAHGDSGVWVHFNEGFSHPWLGADHLLMMFAVGVVARTGSDKSIWQLPCCFWLGMAAGLYWPCLPMGLAEFGIVIALLFIGLHLILRHSRINLQILPWVIFTGLCHGTFHANEIAVDADSTVVFSGLLIATAIIHLSGIAAGQYLHQMPRLRKATGIACMLTVTVLA